MSAIRSPRGHRRGAIVLLTAILMVLLVAVIAFVVDTGYMVAVKTQLQRAADSAALAGAATLSLPQDQVLAEAQQIATLNIVGNKPATLSSQDLVFGTWDSATRTFAPSAASSNAVRVTLRCDDSTGNNRLFFAPIFGYTKFSLQATATAAGNPRDIAFVVDLSGSMNNDTEPCWATYEIENMYGSSYPTVASDLMQKIYTEFGYGAFPGSLAHVGAPAGVATDSSAYANLTKTGGPLTLATVPATYRILSTDSESTRKTKAYKWIIDYQLATLMPAALPVPSSATNLSYWTKYLDFVIQSKSVTGRGTLPPSQDSDRITGLGNPYTDSYPDASTTERDSYRNKLGYRTYMQFMMDMGRNEKPDGCNYVPLSADSPLCPRHNEVTAGGTFSFPPSEEPTHSIRRSLIAAIQEVKLRNASIPSMNHRDKVSIITFDTVSGTVIRQALTGDYDQAMLACTQLQAVADNTSSTATETGLIKASQHLANAPTGSGRSNAEKVVVLMTDGIPNLKSSSDSAVSSYRSSHPSSNYYGGSSYTYDAALMQAATMQGNRWMVFSVGVGLGTDYGFMDRLARMGQTANNSGQSPRTSGNPLAYENEVSAIFKKIISNPQLRLVQ